MAGQEYEILVAAENEFGMSANATESLVTPIGVPDSEPLNIRYVIRQKLVSTALWLFGPYTESVLGLNSLGSARMGAP